MSDFYIQSALTRGEIASALSENPEQALWVLDSLLQICSAEDLVADGLLIDGDPLDVAGRLRKLADEIEMCS